MNRHDRRYRARLRRAENRRQPEALREIPADESPERLRDNPRAPIRVLRSRTYLVQLFSEPDGVVRMSINRTDVNGAPDWVGRIPWDDLQRLKREADYGDRFAVEIYPQDCDVVNVANMRHLWILAQPLDIGWRQ